MSGKLILVPTPIDDEGSLNPDHIEVLRDAFERKDLIVVEEHKAARRRWLRWGLAREAIDEFILYNEHERDIDKINNLISELKSGKNLYLMSDGGMPAFCDPGKRLVERCHQSNIRVSSLEFSNSIILSVALSGFRHDEFFFQGFLPRKQEARQECLKKVSHLKEMVILMDTPYRLKKLLSELSHIAPSREIFIGCDLNTPNELCIRGKIVKITKILGESKREFVLILAPSKT